MAALKGSTSQLYGEKVLPRAKLVPTKDYDEALNMVIEDKAHAMVAEYHFCAVSAFRYEDKGLITVKAPFYLRAHRHRDAGRGSAPGQLGGEFPLRPGWLRRSEDDGGARVPGRVVAFRAAMKGSVPAVLLILLLFLPVLGVAPAWGGAAPDSGETVVQFGEEQGKRAEKGDHRFDYIVAPIPTVNPVLGTGLTLVGALLYRVNPNDNVSPPSLTGLGGFYTSNGSRAAAFIQKLYLKEDRYRILFGAGYFNLFYDFYGIGSGAGKDENKVSLDSEGALFGAEILVRLFGRFYAGPFYRYFPTRTSPNGGLRDALIEIGIPAPQLNLDIGSLGIHLQHDLRDNNFNPAEGHLFDLRAAFQEPSFGSDLTYQKYETSYNYYLGLSGPSVLAMRAAGCYAAGDVPFFDLCLLGSKNDIRGYSVGRYQDRTLLAGQVEYRRGIYKKLGGVVFGGVAQVGKNLHNFNSSDWLPGGGVGLRYLVSEVNKLNLRVDLAQGRDETTLYISVGEAF